MWNFIKQMTAYSRIGGWLEEYIKVTCTVDNKVAREATVLVLRAAEGSNSFHPSDLNRYGPNILAPLAYAMVAFWRGRASQGDFFGVAKVFGILSLAPIASLLNCELDEGYKTIVAKLYMKKGVNQATAYDDAHRADGYLLLLAYVGANDMMGNAIREKRQRPYQTLSLSDFTTEETDLIMLIVGKAQALPAYLAQRTNSMIWSKYIKQESSAEAADILRKYNELKSS
jgi:hypothetical protein